jgi:hypothetical protein
MLVSRSPEGGGPVTPPALRGVWECPAALVRLGLRPFGYAGRGARELVRAPLSLATPPATPAREEPATLQQKLDHLLERALEQSTETSRQELHHRILDQLLPDEARLLSALSDGSAYPLVHVYARSKSGLTGEPLLENACLVGKMANLTLPQLTPFYVSHLLARGLVQVGPEDTALKDDYLILMADNAVLKAVKAGSLGPISPRVERLTLEMSPLGAGLWAAATGAAS